MERESRRAGLAWQGLELKGAKLDTLRAHGEQMWAASREVCELLRSGAGVLVHCSAGLHRTGSFSYLVLRGLGCSAEQAKLWLSRLRPAVMAPGGVGEARLNIMEELISHAESRHDTVEAAQAEDSGLISEEMVLGFTDEPDEEQCPAFVNVSLKRTEPRVTRPKLKELAEETMQILQRGGYTTEVDDGEALVSRELDLTVQLEAAVSNSQLHHKLGKFKGNLQRKMHCQAALVIARASNGNRTGAEHRCNRSSPPPRSRVEYKESCSAQFCQCEKPWWRFHQRCPSTGGSTVQGQWVVPLSRPFHGLLLRTASQSEWDRPFSV